MAQDEGGTAAGDHLATALELLDEGVLTLDGELRVLDVNESALRILGVERALLDEPRWWELVRPRLANGVALDVHRTRRVRVRDLRVRIRRLRDGRSRDLIVHHQPIEGGGCVIAFRDCTEEQRTRRRLEAIAMRDAVTDLPNRFAALRTLDEAIDHRQPFALVLVDVDGFRTVNTGLGQSAGDSVLREIAGRLRGALPRTVRLSRFGNDDFLILAHGGASGAHAIAERVRDAFSEPFAAGQGAHLTASIGIATHDAADDAASLVAAAEAALFRARARGRGLVEVFDDALRRSTDDRLELIADLRRAIDADDIAVAYQPIVALDDESGNVRLVGVEALARWTHPTRGAIPPGVFVALAEDAGLVRALGRRVLARACSEIAALRTTMPRQAGDLELAVNVSARQVASGLLEHDVRAALSVSRLPPRTLGLELTETALMDDAGPRVESLMALRSTGVRLVIDDFGTGYSSLARLRRLPLDGLKIDRSFVSGLGSVAVDTAIVEAVLTMASALRLPVVAEGVETREQSRMLRHLGCPRAQGFLHGRPMGLDELRLRLSSEEWALRSVRVSG
jgi:diguanylate cyclase (GGDEF)-like protein/PAS domain S-box-containing protein